MAAIARRAFLFWCGGLGLAVAGKADNSADVHKVIGAVADALSNDEVDEAMAQFSRKCPNYDKLSVDFGALANAYYVENRLEFPDEDVSDASAEVAVRWDLALTTRQSGFTKNRSAALTVKLMREGKRWRIVTFGPIAIFDPQD